MKRRGDGRTASRPAPQRLQQLDLLRGVAILLVLGSHMYRLAGSSNLPLPLRIWQQCGWCGVDLFFVLSGFLVSGLLFSEYQRHGTLRVGRFLIRRGLKIYPSFYVFMSVTVLGLVLPAIAPHTFSRIGLLRELLFIQNYGTRIWPHTWSLAVEEHFYLSVALLLWLCARRANRGDDPFRRVVPSCLAVMVVCLLLRVWALYPSFTPTRHAQATHLRADALAFGLLLSYAYNVHGDALAAWVRRWRQPMAVFSAVAIGTTAVVPLYSPLMQIPGLTWLYLGCGGVLLLTVYFYPSGNARVARLFGPLAAVGRNSYSIYLWHIPMSEWLHPVTSRLSGPYAIWAGLAIFCGGAIAVGVGMAALVEFPVLRVRDRLFPSLGSAVRLPAVADTASPGAALSAPTGAKP